MAQVWPHCTEIDFTVARAQMYIYIILKNYSKIHYVRASLTLTMPTPTRWFVFRAPFAQTPISIFTTQLFCSRHCARRRRRRRRRCQRGVVYAHIEYDAAAASSQAG